MDVQVNSDVLLLLHSTLATAELYVMPALIVLNDDTSVVTLERRLLLTAAWENELQRRIR